MSPPHSLPPLQPPLPPPPVDLDNCAREPIHIPGFVQPHGVLLAIDGNGRLTHASRNARTVLARLPPLGTLVDAQELTGDSALAAALASARHDAARGSDVGPTATEITLDGAMHDVVVHAWQGRVIVEFERREAGFEDLASFALMAHRGMGRVRGKRDAAAILDEAVDTVRQLTGFDRVMAYRFHGDDSGEVVAEVRDAALEPYLGRRFPASDIPAQARRLYAINTLRLIADVADAQVPIDAVAGETTPLDLSHSILRSVSPIHVEYLKNIDVAASMSISIMVGGRLWGLIACHHRQARRVSYSVRMACDVLAQVVSAAVQVTLEKASGARRSAAADLRARLVGIAVQGEDVLEGLASHGAELARVLPCDALLHALGNQQQHSAALAAEAAGPLVRWLDEQPLDLLAMAELSALPAPLAASLRPFCGLLAIRFDRVNGGWIVLLRREQAVAVTWSTLTATPQRIGPLGERLTPAGSFTEWQQVVENTARPWDAADLAIAGELLDPLSRASTSRTAEIERARAHLLAVLGHDLRDPLNSISMAARLILAGSGGPVIAHRISASAGRMSRLISQVLDMSRLHGGLGLGIHIERGDLAALIRGLVDEAALAYPAMVLRTELPETLDVDMDQDRMSQVIVNLISNARQHGVIGEAIDIRLAASPPNAVMSLSNVAEPIAIEAVARLFDPLKHGAVGNQRNPDGLGLGLYIASEVVKGHRGSIGYEHDGERVFFTVSLPLRRAA